MRTSGCNSDQSELPAALNSSSGLPAIAFRVDYRQPIFSQSPLSSSTLSRPNLLVFFLHLLLSFPSTFVHLSLKLSVLNLIHALLKAHSHHPDRAEVNCLVQFSRVAR